MKITDMINMSSWERVPDTNNAIYDYMTKFVNGDRVLINLICTEFCNFKCAHCLFDHGPHMPVKYLSNEQLDKIEERIKEIKGADIEVNIIGGEPTTNFRHFERIYERVCRWLDLELIRDIDISTNGHWLKNEKQTYNFFRIIMEHTPDGAIENGGGQLHVRISNSPYHEAFRPSHIQKSGDLENRLFSAVNGYGTYEMDDNGFYPLYEITEATCCECNTLFEVNQIGSECPECHEGLIEATNWEEKLDPMPPILDMGDNTLNWIIVDDQPNSPIPSGRGWEVGGNNDKGMQSPGKCAHGDIVSYDPTGSNMDICCNGSNFKWADMDTPIPMMLIASKMYVQSERPTCYSCKDQGEMWVDHHWNHIRSKLKDDWYEFVLLKLNKCLNDPNEVGRLIRNY